MLILATIVTAAIAAPVLIAPSERVFGMDIAGRHHDPFTVMQQFTRPLDAGVYAQPVTDATGAVLARVAGPVAAYNWLVLLSFPLSALAAFLLARHLTLAPAGAMVAAMAFAFSPFHLAQAAYHPHVAQIQWLPLYLLALWRCLDDASPRAVGFLMAATAAVTLSNFYGGMIAAALTPVAIAAYWFVACRGTPGALRRLGVTMASLALIAAAGAAYASHAAAAVVASPTSFAFPRADLFRYSAKWWSYLVPPVEHPLLGATARRIWIASGVREGLLEQQVSLGWGVVALGIVAIVAWWYRTRESTAVSRVPLLAVVAVAALLCSLSPERTIAGFTFVRPSALLYVIAPMFRSYARFGVVVQLMAALLAGIAVDALRRSGTMRGRAVCAALVAVAAAEYAVSPFAMWRDVLPTRAHRWVARQPGRVHALDCAPLTQESASVQWLTGDRVTLAGGPIADCAEPDLPEKLAAYGYTHVIVRRGTADSQRFDDHAPPDGLRVAARFADGRVFAVTGSPPAVYTSATAGLYTREHDGTRTWQWMGDDAEWTIVNSGPRTVAATLHLELSAFQRTRRMDVLLDGQCLQSLAVSPVRGVYPIGPLILPPGDHRLVFHPADRPGAAGGGIEGGDPRRLSFALGGWTWAVEGERR